MKKTFLILLASCGITGFFAFTGCIKDDVLPSAENTHALSRKAPNFGGFHIDATAVTGFGTVSGKILPLEAQPTIFLIGTTTIELFLNDDGTIDNTEVPEGNYSVYIQPGNLNYLDHTIDNITVNPNSATDLGTIALEYGYYGGGGGCEVGWGRIKRGT